MFPSAPESKESEVIAENMLQLVQKAINAIPEEKDDKLKIEKSILIGKITNPFLTALQALTDILEFANQRIQEPFSDHSSLTKLYSSLLKACNVSGRLASADALLGKVDEMIQTGQGNRNLMKKHQKAISEIHDILKTRLSDKHFNELERSLQGLLPVKSVANPTQKG